MFERSRKGLAVKYTKRTIERPRSLETKTLIAAAREKLEEFKAQKGLKAIVPRSKNQKLATKKANQARSLREATQLVGQSFGAASEVRTIKPEEA